MAEPPTPRERAEALVSRLDARLADTEAVLPTLRRDLEELKELLSPTEKDGGDGA